MVVKFYWQMIFNKKINIPEQKFDEVTKNRDSDAAMYMSEELENSTNSSPITTERVFFEVSAVVQFYFENF